MIKVSRNTEGFLLTKRLPTCMQGF